MNPLTNGIIFPDVVWALKKCNIIKSEADLMLKLERGVSSSDENKINGGLKRFRTVRKMFSGKPTTKKDKKQAFLEFKVKVPFEAVPLSKHLKYSDFKCQASNYKAIKGFTKGLCSEVKSDEALNLDRFVENLCEEEKKLSNRINTNILLEAIKKHFHISEVTLEEEINKIDSNNIDNLILDVIKLHQFLLLFSIIEQFTYISFSKHLTKQELKKHKMIANILPTADKGEYHGSVGKLLDKIIEGLGFKNQIDLCKALSRTGVDEIWSIERRLNRWKNGESRITPNGLNELIHRLDKGSLPEELIFISCLIDITARKLMTYGLPEEWIVNEFHLYYKYQETIQKALFKHLS